MSFEFLSKVQVVIHFDWREPLNWWEAVSKKQKQGADLQYSYTLSQKQYTTTASSRLLGSDRPGSRAPSNPTKMADVTANSTSFELCSGKLYKVTVASDYPILSLKKVRATLTCFRLATYVSDLTLPLTSLATISDRSVRSIKHRHIKQLKKDTLNRDKALQAWNKFFKKSI